MNALFAGFSGAEDLRWLIPAVALSLMLLEALNARLRHDDPAYDAGETAASLAVAIGGKLVQALTAVVVTVPMLFVYEHRLFDIPLDSVWAIGGLFLGLELVYYWQHRASHEIAWFWATHSVHHSATRFNLSAAIRLGWTSGISGHFLFYLPLLLIGFHPLAVLGMLGVNLLYQFFLHAARAPRLGPLEWVLNTPTHHRVHHASNASCLDRNYGGIVIVWDRLFGTFAEAPRDETLRFGLVGSGAPTRNPLRIALGGWVTLWRKVRDGGSFGTRLGILFGRP